MRGSVATAGNAIGEIISGVSTLAQLAQTGSSGK
jgi:hypothetical protein